MKKLKELIQRKREEKNAKKLHKRFFKAIGNGVMDDIKECLKENSDLINSRSPLRISIEKKFKNQISYLIDKGSDVNETNESTGKSLLHELCIRRDSRSVEAFVKSKSLKINAQDLDGKTALHEACIIGEYDIVVLLVQNGADLAIKTENDNTAIHFASNNGHIRIVKYLVEQGADMNVKNKYGSVPIHDSSFQGHIKVVQFLISQGADLNLKNKNGEKPVDLARKKGRTEVVKALGDQ